ncbi:MerR family transcriptional regulator [Microbispora hainanensis]|uniref:MerR family transcriptional regulator n=1 Tax=Microbispora hainanensis TaxID=568844 RepID=UPI001ABF2CC4|nr:MerR family transcriptional regulator [Microbispora hainanensis]
MRIGELAALAGVSTRTVRHYHHQGVLPEPPRRVNGYREYGLRDALRLGRARRLTELGLSLDEVRDALTGDSARELREILLELDADLARQEAEIRSRRERLAALLREESPSPDGLRLRYGRLFGLDVPAELIASARIDRRYDEKKLVRLSDGELALAVSSQTNLVVELREPIEVPPPRRPWQAVRPAVAVRRVRFFADDPAAALRAVAALSTTATGERGTS